MEVEGCPEWQGMGRMCCSGLYPGDARAAYRLQGVALSDDARYLMRREGQDWDMDLDVGRMW